MATNDQNATFLASNGILPRLVIQDGPQAGKNFPLIGDGLTIGRSNEAQIVLQDQMTSRLHARIDWQNGHFGIEDLGSSNGTFVNNVQITSRHLLNSGDKILIGQSILLFQGGQTQEDQAKSKPSSPPLQSTILRAQRLSGDSIPARLILTTAIEANQRAGNENFGFLSESHGIMPSSPPLLHLPPEYKAWDEMAEGLPELYRTLRVRKALEAMPILSAAKEQLPDEYLLRASVIMSILAHAYYRVQADSPQNPMPNSVQKPWEEITRRLNRPAPHLSYIDLIMYNWRLIDPNRDDPMRVENLRLLVPTVDNKEERIFYLTQVEILAQCSPLIGVLVGAQEAVTRDDAEALKQELILITDRLHHVTYESFMNINPNPHSDSYVDPVVWAKTVAPFAVPINKDSAGPSGTSAPIFHVLDVFFGRQKYDTRFGKEMLHLRPWYPRHWQNFIEALGEVSVTDYVEKKGDPSLKGILKDVTQAFAGNSGFLSRHRLKVYGYLDIGFKVGRNVTITGFTGLFKDRTWDQVETELASSQEEREHGFPQSNHFASIKSVDMTSANGDPNRWVKRVVFDISNTGIRYQPGDRVAVLPENDEDLVDKTLAALRAKGYETIPLTKEWREAINLREGFEGATTLPLRTLLKFGRIRPVDRLVAKILYAASLNENLSKIIEARAEDQWELWDLVEMLSKAGYDPKRFWKGHPGEQGHICRVIPPESFRMYSISSSNETDFVEGHEELHLTIGRLSYETRDSDVSGKDKRFGTSSHFLGNRSSDSPQGTSRVSLRVVHPPRFNLPENPAIPIVMFAGGTGIAPFRGFIQERAKQKNPGKSWLFLGVRSKGDFYYQAEFDKFAAQGQLNLRLAFSQDAVDAKFDSTSGHFNFQTGEKRHIGDEMLKEENSKILWDLLRSEKDGGQGAYFYVCGRTDFAKSVMRAIKEILYRYFTGPEDKREAEVNRTLYRMVGEERYMQDIFTTYTGSLIDSQHTYDASQVALHNNDEKGYWMVLNGRIYDMGEFSQLHPGGAKIIAGYAGMDATQAYQTVRHHLNPEVDSMLGMYEIGIVRRLTFGMEWGVVIGPDGLRFISLGDVYRVWIRFLYNVVEMQNALNNDYSLEGQSLTQDEKPDSYPPIKLQYLLEVHNRFMANYLESAIGKQLENLWAVTSGICRQDQDVDWLRKTVDKIRKTEEADTVERLSDELETRIKGLVERGADENNPVVALVRDYCALLKGEDQLFLAEMKSALRAGVMVFEQYERDTIKLGSGQLLETARQIPKILETYHSRVLSHALRALLAYTDR
ncbi:MAG: FHA domain-containing protein [Anaerolineaceae bacterium]|nr:FHA domain-containing protein [Anaerolineaceae bacterium]